MRSGRYTGAGGDRRLALRIDSGEMDSLERVSGDVIAVGPDGRESFLLSFAFDAARLPAVIGVPALAAADPSLLAFGLSPETETRGTAELVLTRMDGAPEERLSFTIEWRGPEFRELAVRLMVVPGARAPDAPELPAVVPESGSGAALTPVGVAEALRRGGVALVLERPVELPAGGAGEDSSWSRAELAAAAAALTLGVPVAAAGTWRVPLLIAGRFEEPGVLGVMLHSDPGNALGRISAVFFDEIPRHGKVRGDPVRQAREYLFTTVHELGHVLGLPHAWDPLGELPRREHGASALTFMNYPDLYRLGYTEFYRAFPFEFGPEERAFLRHAPWPAVWPGPREAGAPEADIRRSGAGLELELRSPRAGALVPGEPVQLEVKLANRGRRRLRAPADLLRLEGGRLRAFVAREGEPGPGRRFRPLAQVDVRSARVPLGEAAAASGAPASLYDVVDLTYGCDGFAFAVPGRYRVTVAARVSPRREVWSAPLAIEVAEPPPALAALAGELLRPAVGRALALGLDPAGSARPVLERVASSTGLPSAAAVSALRLGEALAQRFKRLGDGGCAAAEPEEAAAWLERAEELARGWSVLSNPVVSRLLERRARCLAASGRPAAAGHAFDALLGFVDRTITTDGRLRRRVRRELRRRWSTG